MLRILGSLSSEVFLRDARQPEVSLFSLLICLDATKFVLLAVFTLIETICPNICSKSRLKIAKSQLPVYVRRSKTSLFKPPNSFSIYSETLTMYKTLPFYETCSRLNTKKIRLKEIGTLSALRNALQNTLFPFLNAPPLRFEGGETTASSRLLFHRACAFT